MKLLLQDKELWQKFNEHQTEMMITNSGRRMCPLMSIAFEDLKPRRSYAVMVDFVLMDAFKYSYNGTCNRWEANTSLLPEENWPRLYVHPSTPATGASLMQNALTFKTLKLTNCPVTAADSTQAILLSTMRRYIPRIQVVESADGVSFDYNLRKEFYFPETEFMAVSQYRNKQIAQLKIEANPFAKAFRRDGLHGKAKRRRIETMTACDYWKTPEYGLPSNCSRPEDFLVNSGEPDEENNSSSNELADEHSPGESFNCDERQVNGTRENLASQTGLCQDALDVRNKIQNETANHESLPIASEATQPPSSNPTSENDSHLLCEESTEWMWGFDEQMSFRYASNGQLDGLFKYGDSPKDSSKNSIDADEAAKATVNRRKKYLPRRLQRTVSSTNLSLEGNMESEPTDKLAVDQVDLPSLQPNDKTSISGNGGNEQQSCCTDEQTTRSTASPCFEPVARPSISCKTSLHPQRRNSHTDAMHATCSVSGESLATPANSMLSTVTPRPGNTTGSSLTALMQMCSDAESSLDSRRSMRQLRTVTNDISKKLEMTSTPGRKDVFPGELAEVRMSASKESSAGPVTSQDCDSTFQRQVETSTASSCGQLSQQSDYNFIVPVTSEGEEWARPCTVTSSTFNGHVTSSGINSTPPSFNYCNSSSDSTSMNTSDISATSPVFSNPSSSGSYSMNSFISATSSDMNAISPAYNNSSDSGSHSMNSFVRTTSSDIAATPSVFSNSGDSSSHNINSFVQATSSNITVTPPVFTNYSGHSMHSSVHVTSSNINSTPAVFNIYSNRNTNSMNSFSVSDTVSKSPTSTYLCQTAGSSAVSRGYTCIEGPSPTIVDTFSSYYIVNEHNSGQLQQSKQQGYRPIVPAPNHSVNVCSDEPASDPSLSSSCRGNDFPFPIIIDSFSINENFRAAVGHRSFKYKILESLRQANPVSNLMPQQTSPPPQVNRGHFSSPYPNQTGRSGYIALDNTVLMKAFSLEKFYSFSAPAEQQPQSPSLRPLTRCYKTTRTNFSRMSLEPICSVIHPLIDLASQKSATEVANQRTWVWGI